MSLSMTNGKPNSNGRKTVRNAAGRSAKGNGGGPGRPRGRSRATALRDAFQWALDELGGERFIVETARKHPVEFLRLIAGMLPTHAAQTAHKDDESGGVQIVCTTRTDRPLASDAPSHHAG